MDDMQEMSMERLAKKKYINSKLYIEGSKRYMVSHKIPGV